VPDREAEAARLKLAVASPQKVVSECRGILAMPRTAHNTPEGAFWRLCYHPSTLAELCILREDLLMKCDTEARILLRAILLGILHGPRYKGSPGYLSNQMPRTYATKPEPAVTFWRKFKLKPVRISLAELVERRANLVLRAIPGKVGAKCSELTADTFPRSWEHKRVNKFGCVITSPPYAGMRTYSTDQWLRRWFLGGPPYPDYDQKNQVGRLQGDGYIAELATVWKQVAEVCMPRARLVVRFGAMASSPEDPRETLLASLRDSACWRVLTVMDAGAPPRARRQATQFALGDSKAKNEIDLHAVLEV